MRLLIASTPRSGNTWLRMLVARIYGLAQLAVHRPGDVDWHALPRDCVVQLHWLPTAALKSALTEAGAQTIVLARHPLDVLISILHFAQQEPQTAQWLDGDSGSEADIIGKSPISQELLRYGCSPRFRALLEVSGRWWTEVGVARVKYESLVADSVGTLIGLSAQLGEQSVTFAQAVEESRIDHLRARSSNDHFWQGRPGLWRRLLPMAVAQEIQTANEACFRVLGYHSAPDLTLTRDAALENWRALA